MSSLFIPFSNLRAWTIRALKMEWHGEMALIIWVSLGLFHINGAICPYLWLAIFWANLVSLPVAPLVWFMGSALNHSPQKTVDSIRGMTSSNNTLGSSHNAASWAKRAFTQPEKGVFLVQLGDVWFEKRENQMSATLFHERYWGVC